MATVAIGTNLDAHWRVFQTKEKPLTPRGRSRLRGNRRTRGHEVLAKHNGSPKHSGRRAVALVGATAGDLASGFMDFLESLSEQASTVFWSTPDYVPNRRRWESQRLQEDTAEVAERQHILLGAIEFEYCEKTHTLFAIRLECERLAQEIEILQDALASATTQFEISKLEERILEKSLERDLLHYDVELLDTYQPAA